MSRYYYQDDFQPSEDIQNKPEASLSVHLRRSKNLIANAKELLNENPFDDNSSEKAESGRCRSSIGIMFTGSRIENLMAGGPAQLSGELEVGDVVLYVDGHHVEGDALRMGTYLRGDDIPGTLMSLIVKKANGAVKNVELTRMSSANIQDTRRVLELFSLLRTKLANKTDAESVQQLDRIYEIWAKIQASENGRLKGTRDRLDNQLIQTKLILGKLDETIKEISELVEPRYTNDDFKSRTYQDRNLSYDQPSYDELLQENNTLRAEVVRLQNLLIQNEEVSVREAEIAKNEMNLIVAEMNRLQETVQQLKVRSNVSNFGSPDSRRSSSHRDETPASFRDSWQGQTGQSSVDIGNEYLTPLKSPIPQRTSFTPLSSSIVPNDRSSSPYSANLTSMESLQVNDGPLTSQSSKLSDKQANHTTPATLSAPSYSYQAPSAGILSSRPATPPMHGRYV
uniref:PDZ domain-containing protein n=1 Tax=Hanusia phi TaxID=3032 RepID=A0A7S0H4T0_9CRYP|mmetsp:Transcript_10408/g.23809  ORF Transcript_10408/g.23809 Transcript_10408/m.23809 type:complete len:453 (+) Transcript_10408:392-1750(+)